MLDWVLKMPLSTLLNGSYFWNYHNKQKLKYLNLGPKMSYLDIFELEFENSIVINEIAIIAKFDLKTLIPNFGTKNV